MKHAPLDLQRRRQAAVFGRQRRSGQVNPLDRLEAANRRRGEENAAAAQDA